MTLPPIPLTRTPFERMAQVIPEGFRELFEGPNGMVLVGPCPDCDDPSVLVSARNGLIRRHFNDEGWCPASMSIHPAWKS